MLTNILKKYGGTLCLLMVLAVMLGLAGHEPAQAQDGADPIWQASYWNNRRLAGFPEIQRNENEINYNWGLGSPDPEIDDDDFSARWVAYVYFQPGTYRFTAASDDGIRVWVDGDLIIDEWYNHPLTTFTADKSLSDGRHQITVEYYEDQSGAIVQFWWAPAPPRDGQNWRGEYYNNMSLSGSPALVREDPAIAFNWTDVRPAPGVRADKFSVRWTRSVNLPRGNYRFRMTVDDGGRLWVNGRLLIDAWRVQSPHTYTAEIHLPGGSTPLRMEYFENLAGAVAQLSWERVTPAADGWRAEYYNSTSFRGEPAVVRYTPEIDFNWGDGSPAPGVIGSDFFSARWTRSLNLPPGTYRFSMRVDDGGRLWVDDKLLLNAWQVQAPRTYTNQIYLSDQPTHIRMEYFENTGGAVAELSWQRVGSMPVQPTPPPPVRMPTPQPPLDWRAEIPEQYHPIFQRCLQQFDQVSQDLDPTADLNALLQQCIELTRTG